MLFPLLVGGGFVATTSQLVGQMRLRQAIQQEATALGAKIDVSLIAPVLLDPKAGVDRSDYGRLCPFFFSGAAGVLLNQLNPCQVGRPAAQSSLCSGGSVLFGTLFAECIAAADWLSQGSNAVCHVLVGNPAATVMLIGPKVPLPLWERDLG